MSWVLNLVYCGLLLLFSPVIFFRAIWRGKYRAGWGEKFLGRVPVRTSSNPAIWLHAVSVGEVLILAHVAACTSRAGARLRDLDLHDDAHGTCGGLRKVSRLPDHLLPTRFHLGCAECPVASPTVLDCTRRAGAVAEFHSRGGGEINPARADQRTDERTQLPGVSSDSLVDGRSVERLFADCRPDR